MPERLDTVTIALSSGEVTLGWPARDALLDELAHLESSRGVSDAFAAVDATQPLTLSLEQKGDLLVIIEHWANQTGGGFESLPDGIFDLRNALHDDLQDAGLRSDPQ